MSKIFLLRGQKLLIFIQFHFFRKEVDSSKFLLHLCLILSLVVDKIQYVNCDEVRNVEGSCLRMCITFNVVFEYYAHLAPPVQCTAVQQFG